MHRARRPRWLGACIASHRQMFMAVVASADTRFQVSYTLVTSSAFFTSQSILLWMVVSFLCLMSLVFLAVFVIKARQFRRFQCVQTLHAPHTRTWRPTLTGLPCFCELQPHDDATNRLQPGRHGGLAPRQRLPAERAALRGAAVRGTPCVCICITLARLAITRRPHPWRALFPSFSPFFFFA